jgi:dipeptidyl aminopeptidase/acylaminoacyl peptidase
MKQNAWALAAATFSAVLAAACGVKEEPAAPPASATAESKPAGKPAPELIARNDLFGNPERASPQLSPDGRLLGFLAPLDGVVNVWVAPVDNLSQAHPVTKWKERPVSQYFFAYDNAHLVYLQDKGGNENFHAYSVDLASDKEIDLTPLKDVRAQIVHVSPKVPKEILVGINDRGDHSLHDLYRVNLATGERKLLEKNPGFETYLVDYDFRVRAAYKPLPDGSYQWLKKAGKTWAPFAAVPKEDTLTTQPVGFDSSGKTLYWLDSRGRDTGALFAQDWKTGKPALLLEDARADVGGVLSNPVTQVAEAAAVDYERVHWTPLGDAVKADLEFLKTLGDGEVEVLTRSQDDKRWLVSLMSSDKPLHYFLYDREHKSTKLLFSHRPWLEGKPLAPMYARVIPSRDGMNLVSYLTLPVEADEDHDGVPDQPLPMVLDVHGGPWGRDGWGFNNEHLWLANRGYAVLSVNFRASTGFGKKFVNAGNLEWAGKMHDDLLDAVAWAVKNKVADPGKVAIMGGSYGGYATLVGMTFTPDEFACGVDIVGPSNLVTLLNSIPPYWKTFFEQFATRVGDPRTDDGKKLLEARSPLNFADKIKKPLLIGQGANDPRVHQAESDRIVAAMQAKKIPVTYVLYPDEGHGFYRATNRRSFYAVSEAFLGQCLGGRIEPVGKDFDGSTLQVKAGAEFVPGIADAMKGAAASAP